MTRVPYAIIRSVSITIGNCREDISSVSLKMLVLLLVTWTTRREEFGEKFLA